MTSDIKSHDREIKTVMHELKRRALTVRSTEMLTSKMKRIKFTAPELSDFRSLSPDDHIKIFFENPSGGEPVMRDYTPRAYSNEKQELTIDFYLHENGVGSSWAKSAKTGDLLNIGGPRGSKIVPYAFDGYLMLGDESSLPSFARRLEELPASAKAVAIIEVEDESQKVELKIGGDVEVHWVYRKGSPLGDAGRFAAQLDRVRIPAGDLFAWVSMEKSAAFALQDILIQNFGVKKEWMKTTGYWSQG